MHKRNYFHSNHHAWPPIYRRTAGGTNWHQPTQEQQSQSQEDRYREIARQRQEILAQMDGAGAIAWGIVAAVVALLFAVLGALAWN